MGSLDVKWGNLAFSGHQVTSRASDVILVAQTFPWGRVVQAVWVLWADLRTWLPLIMGSLCTRLLRPHLIGAGYCLFGTNTSF